MHNIPSSFISPSPVPFLVSGRTISHQSPPPPLLVAPPLSSLQRKQSSPGKKWFGVRKQELAPFKCAGRENNAVSSIEEAFIPEKKRYITKNGASIFFEANAQRRLRKKRRILRKKCFGKTGTCRWVCCACHTPGRFGRGRRKKWMDCRTARSNTFNLPPFPFPSSFRTIIATRESAASPSPDSSGAAVFIFTPQVS